MVKIQVYRTVMRIGIVFIMCLMTQVESFATHIAGAEIFYEHLLDNKYKFKLKVYRDCKECKFNNIGGGDNISSCNEVPNLLIKGALGTNYYNNDFGSIDIARTSIKDVTNTCYSSISKCRSNSNSQYGFELHEFEGVFDFTNLIAQGYCQIDVSIGMSSRNININTQRSEQNFYNFTYLNLCEGVINQSTVFTSDPQFIRPINQTHYEALGVLNVDKDSLVFKLKPALVTRTISVSYANNKNYNYPFDFYCTGVYPCAPNLNKPIPEGFYCASESGDVVFTPTVVNQGGVVVVECEEWKKNKNGVLYLAGVTRRDIYSETVNSNNNLPTFKSQVNQFQVCEGETNQGFDLPAMDLPVGLNSDTLFASITTDLPNVSLLQRPINSVPYYTYSLQIGDLTGYSGNHLITVYLRDNHCPLNGIVSKTLMLKVLKKRSVDVDKAVKNCGVFEASLDGTDSDPIFWTLSDINGLEIAANYSKKIITQLPKGGKYILKKYLPAGNGYCELDQKDTFVVDDFIKPTLYLGKDTIVCKGSDVNIKAQALTTHLPYMIYVNGTLNQLPYNLKAIGNQTVIVKVLQSDGCSTEDAIKVNVFPELVRKISNDTICTNTQFPIALKYPKVDSNLLVVLNPSSTVSEISFKKKSDFQWEIESSGISSGLKTIHVYMKDKNTCEYNDQFNLVVLKPDTIDIRLPQSLCINTEPLNLTTRAKGSWTCVSQSDLVQNNVLKPLKSTLSNIVLKYTELRQCPNSKLYHIALIDTAALTSNLTPVTTICENQSPFQLEAQPSNGDWTGIHVNNGFYDASQAAGSKNKVTYTYSNLSACVSQLSREIAVEKLPEIELSTSKNRICFGDVLKLYSENNTNQQGYWYSDGGGTFELQDSKTSIYYPNIVDISMPLVTFTYTIQTNTACGNVTEEVQVMVRDGQVGEILNNYPKEKCEPAAFNFSTNYKRLEKQEWYINDSLYEIFDYNFNLQVSLKAGEYIVKTNVRDSTCEAFAISEKITVLPKPHVQMFSNPSSRMSRDYSRLYLKDLSYSKFGHRNIWYLDNDSISASPELNFKVEVQRDTFHVKLLAVSLKGGCVDSTSQMFVFIPVNQLYIPDAFSPDSKGPNENNVFKVYGPAMKKINIEIFNKFGEKIYKSNNMDESWDGTYKGTTCMNGVYFYKVETEDFDGVSVDYSGTITLIR